MKKEKRQLKGKKVLFSGGGTMGSVMPLLALKDDLQKENAEFLWIGTEKGPEKEVVEKAKIEFKSIYSGKLRRYFSWKNFIAPFLSKIGFWQSFFIILKYKPDIILTAGGFVCVPVVWAGWILRKKIIVHQQDLKVGLSNKLMAPFATKITVSFRDLKKYFPKSDVEVTGNPVRKMIFRGSKESAVEKFSLDPDWPVLLIMGGGTGALFINKLIEKILPELLEFCQIIHITGKNKQIDYSHPKYHSFDFLYQKLADAYAVADLAVSRAGFGALTELAVLGKPAILIPLPNEDQLNNARFFAKKNAVIFLNQKELTKQMLLKKIKELIKDEYLRQRLSKNIREIMPKSPNEKYIQLIEKILKY